MLRYQDKRFFLSSIILSIGLSGCISVATTSAQAVYNHQSIERNMNDQYITLRSYQAIDIDSDHFKNANINISTFNNIILLSGQVPEPWQKIESEEKIRKVAGVNEVHNWISVEQPSSKWARISDAWITAKIKSSLIFSNEVDATQIKVITENGVVYLMGVLQPKEAETAAKVASKIEGVQEVVKLFSYWRISKTPA